MSVGVRPRPDPVRAGDIFPDLAILDYQMSRIGALGKWMPRGKLNEKGRV